MNFKIKTDNKSIKEYLFFIGVLLLVIIPKGGFKIAGVPITWGYLYLGSLFGLILFSLDVKKHLLSKTHIISYLATLPFVFYLTLNIIFKGYDGTIGNLIAIFISLVFLPFLFYFFLSPFLKKININYIENLIYNAVFYVALYGIFLFIIKQSTGNYIEIPYFTVNGDETTDIGEKFNNRGGIFKLFSTYNNGNIYGVCTLMLFPIFNKINKSRFKTTVVILAIVLTLSRTAWIGLLFYYIVVYRSNLIKLVKTYFTFGLLVLLLGSFLFGSLFRYGSMADFILDANLGGRLIQLKKLNELSFFGEYTFKAIEEIVYLSILKQLGLIGLVLFCLSFFTPIAILISTRKFNHYIVGLIVYCFVCFSDGCMIYIPTLAFVYFISTMSLINNSSTNNEN